MWNIHKLSKMVQLQNQFQFSFWNYRKAILMTSMTGVWDTVTVGDIVRFIKKSHRFSSSIQWQLESHRGWLMDPHRGLSLRGDATNALPLLEPGTWCLRQIVCVLYTSMIWQKPDRLLGVCLVVKRIMNILSRSVQLWYQGLAVAASTCLATKVGYRPCIISDGPVGPSLAPESAESCY